VSLRILVVDDDPITRRVTSAMLSINGFEVTNGETGRDAVRLAGTSRPDAIVIDIFMPEMDGLTAIDALKADPRTRDIPVLAVSGLPSDEIAGEAVARGAAGFLQKPFPVRALIEKVRHLNIIETAPGV
jgi:CheY-like chemotaxis protein